ncbi:MAG: UDP-3-O-(3-hydroxymyristoyl)glucosamine N-acyltransferase [Chlamydiae bacterium]|nr:UDP-3-O-(3-hydroxymyristoyl)glucosamine N-acyltransferase [Chlamydiota bacterium]
MKAVILAMGHCPGMDPLISYRPTPLLNVADKPIIFYIIEFLVQKGIRNIDLVISHLPEQIEEKLDDGKRWGAEICYHLAKDPNYPFSVLAPLARGWKEQKILLGQGDSIPALEHFGLQQANVPLLLNYSEEEWSGWGVFAANTLSDLSPHTTLDEIPSLLRPQKVEIVKPFLSVRGCKTLKETNQRFMAADPPRAYLPTTARKVEPGVWISRAVSMEPGVEIVPPVFIGENTHIKSGAHLGPGTIIENNCIIDSNSTIENSIVCQRSYVGENLEIKDCIVDRNCLINLALNTQLKIMDEFILSDSVPPALHYQLRGLLERFCALLLFIPLSPFFLVMVFLCSLKREKKLSLPATNPTEEWRAFDLLTFAPRKGKDFSPFTKFFRCLPMLISIFKGDVHFVGVHPRSMEEVNRLPKEWRELYLKAKVGIITLCDSDHGPSPTVDDTYAAEAFYASQKGWVFDMKLIFRWLWRKIKRNAYAD